jgi:hypothetical protein
VAQAASEWGLPIVLLAALGLAAGALGPSGAGPKEMRGLALTGLPFLLAAALTPLEVRYLYAVSPAVALLAADGLLRAAQPGPRSALWRASAGVALTGQAVLFLTGAGRAIFDRYRELTPFP